MLERAVEEPEQRPKRADRYCKRLVPELRQVAAPYDRQRPVPGPEAAPVQLLHYQQESPGGQGCECQRVAWSRAISRPWEAAAALAIGSAYAN